MRHPRGILPLAFRLNASHVDSDPQEHLSLSLYPTVNPLVSSFGSRATTVICPNISPGLIGSAIYAALRPSVSRSSSVIQSATRTAPSVSRSMPIA